jgi:Zn-dependent protease with chaperone function
VTFSTEALWPLGFALGAAALVPQLTGRTLALLLLRKLPAEGEERRRRLFTFRQGAFFVGLVQIQLAWALGVSRAVAPSIEQQPGGPLALAAGALCAITAFVSGGLARRTVEHTPDTRTSALGVAALRLRLVPMFAGPMVGALLAAQLPVTRGDAVSLPWALIALCVTALSVAYGGLLLGLLTGTLRPAPAALRLLARDVAAREGVRLALVLRLPTGDTRFANAAALPWARTMIVTDRLAARLPPDELRAVLAHEAGHLSESAWVGAARLGSATLFVFALTVGVRLADALGAWGVVVIVSAVLLGLIAFVRVRKLARKMEERADAHACANVGAAEFARALRAIHDDAEAPLVTSSKRVHPDLWDRLSACGDDPGPRPPPPSKGAGVVTALLVLALLIGAGTAVELATSFDADDAVSASADRALWRLRLAPWDAEAMLASGWSARRDGDLDTAWRALRWAEALGVAIAPAGELRAELAAEAGDCATARDAFDYALRARARQALDDGRAPLELGGYRLPPTFVRRCEPR